METSVTSNTQPSPSSTNGDMATRASVFLRLKETDAAPRELAWQAFHDRYAPMVHGYARRKGATPQQAEDIVQDVMLGFFSASPRFAYDPAVGRFRGYLRVCVHRALKKIRDAQHGATSSSGPSIDELNLADDKAENPADLRLWDDLWERQQLNRILAEVREHYRSKGKIETFVAFERNVLFNEPASKVAADLNLNVASVHMAKVRVTQRLASLRKQLIDEEG